MFFKRDQHRDAGAETVSPNSLLPRRMDLEERKAFRRELLDQLIRESLDALTVAPGMYRLRIMPLDARHHRFAAMVDVGQDLQLPRAKRPWNFHDIEAHLKKCAFERFGLVLDGVYWRVGTAVPAGRLAGHAVPPPPNPCQLVSDEEKQALMEAIRNGSELPVLHVGDREYVSEMVPLEEDGR